MPPFVKLVVPPMPLSNIRWVLNTGIRNAVSSLCSKTATNARRQAQRAYEKYASSSVGPAAVAKQVGKREGAVNAARPPRSSPSSTQALRDAVVVYGGAASSINQVGPSQSWMVTIGWGYHGDARKNSRTMGFPLGVPLTLLAYWMEFPKPYFIPVTARMLGYIFDALRPKRAGYGSRPKTKAIEDNAVTGKVISVTPKPRPVWRETFDAACKYIEKNAASVIDAVIKKALAMPSK